MLTSQSVCAQEFHFDTTKLTISDTSIARKYFDDAIELIKIAKYEEAFTKADTARMIFEKVLGYETSEVADAWNQMGRCKFTIGVFKDAIDCFKQAERISSKKTGPYQHNLANILDNLASVYNSNGEPRKAIEYRQKALNIRLKNLDANNPLIAYSYNSIGNAYISIREFDKAIEYHNKALNIRLKNLGADHLDVGQSYYNLGATYFEKGQFDQAIIFCQKALEIRLKGLDQNHPKVAQTYTVMGNSFRENEEFDDALECHKKALEIYLSALSSDNTWVAYSYNNLGTTYVKKGKYNIAILYFQKALNIQLKNLGKEHAESAGSYVNLGVTYSYIGDNSKSIEYLKKGLFICLKNYGPESSFVADSYSNLGNSYNDVGEYDKAIECYQKSLEIYIKNFGQEHPSVALSYSNLGNPYKAKGFFEQSIACYQKSLDIRFKATGHETLEVAGTYENLASLYFIKKNYDKSIEYNQRALEIRQRILGPIHPFVAETYNNLGKSFEAKFDLQKALLNYDSAMVALNYKENNLENVLSIELLVASLNISSKIENRFFKIIRNKDLLDESYSNILQALAALDYQQATLSESDSKGLWQSNNYPIFEQVIDVSLIKSKVENNDTLAWNTFNYSEGSKSVVLQSQLKETDALRYAGIPDSLLQKEFDLRIDITWRQKQRQGLLEKGLTETDTSVLCISSIIFDKKQEYDTLKQTFEKEYPEYYRLKFDHSTVSLQEVQKNLLSPKQTLLEYFVGDSSIYFFVLRPDNFVVREIKKDFPLENWIDSLRIGLYGYYTASKTDRSSFKYEESLSKFTEYAPKLYQKLIGPVVDLLSEQVIVVPDGALGYVPFDALLSETPSDINDFKSYPYLLNKYQFSYAYSATLLKEMQEKKHKSEATKNFAAFAPFYDGDTTLLSEMYAYDDLMRKDLNPLVYSGEEVAAASKIMNGDIYAGKSATEEQFASTSNQYRILHLATHARADNRVGDYAYLAFTEIKDSVENELLYVKDLYNLQLNADMVVLSACETGIGKLQRGEGIISLARAFAYAGAKSIVSTLWEVNDKSTSELMKLFYKELKKGKTKDEALRLARLSYLNKTTVRGAHPFFWAAFIPVGDMSKIKF